MHEGGYRVDATGRFFYPWGGEIPAVPSLPPGDPGELGARNRGRATDAATCLPGTGERMDLAALVDSLIAIDRRGGRRVLPAGLR